MNSRFHKVLKLKSTGSSEYSRRIHVLATKKTSLRYTDTIHRNSCTYPRHLQPYLDLSPFVLQGWKKGLVIMCLKNSYITFFFLIHHTKLEAIWWWKKYFIHTIFSSLAFKLSVFKAQVMVIATSTLGAQHCCKWGQPICEV